MKVYLDNGATTMTDPKVIKAMLPYFNQKFGNASSAHIAGQEAKMALEESRATIAKAIGAKPEEIIFTSGGTESDNFAIKGVAYANNKKGNHIITSAIEHPAVLNACKQLEKEGFNITYLGVDREGLINLDQLKEAINDKTILVSIMQANNEIGTIEPITEIGKLCKKNDVYFHTDAVQSFTKTKLDVKKQNLNLVSLNSHKIHGPKGVGALYIKHGTKISKLFYGGSQENKQRAGTENIPGIVGFAKAVKLCKKRHTRHITKLRDKLINGVLEIPEVSVNGPRKERLCNNANFIFKYIEGEALGAHLDVKGICSSTGSACATKSLKPSHVLVALGINQEEVNGSLRLTLSRFTTKEEIAYTLSVLPKIVKSLRKISPLTK